MSKISGNVLELSEVVGGNSGRTTLHNNHFAHYFNSLAPSLTVMCRRPDLISGWMLKKLNTLQLQQLFTFQLN